jgi:hypothetical protein
VRDPVANGDTTMKTGPVAAPPRISVCVVTARRPQQLAACIDSLDAQRDAPPFEVIVGVNGDPGGGQLTPRPGLLVLQLPRQHPGAARNQIVGSARGDLLVFLDDDVTVDPGFLARVDRHATSQPEMSVFGGPNLTPGDSSTLEVAQGCVLGSLFGGGPIRHRYRRSAPHDCDDQTVTLCNLAVRRDAFTAFPIGLACAEENALLHDMARRGHRMRYEPDLAVEHARRPTTAAFASQVRKYGFGRGQLIRHQPSTAHGWHVAAIGAPALLAAACTVATLTQRALWVAPVGLYLLGLLLNAVAAGPRHLVPRVGALTAVCHAAYVVGLVHGLTTRRHAVSPRVHVEPRDAHHDLDSGDPRRHVVQAPS